REGPSARWPSPAPVAGRQAAAVGAEMDIDAPVAFAREPDDLPIIGGAEHADATLAVGDRVPLGIVIGDDRAARVGRRPQWPDDAQIDHGEARDGLVAQPVGDADLRGLDEGLEAIEPLP